MSGRALGDHDRQLANMARIGIVAAIQGNQARVTIGSVTTDWMYWISRRAYADYDWWAPAVGEQVAVLALWGDVSQGIILGAIPQDAQAAPGSGAQWSKRFSDGVVITYDPQAHSLVMSAGQSPVTITCKSATVTASDSVTVDTPKAVFTGDMVCRNLTASGDVVASGKSLKGHLHPYGSGSVTGMPE